MAKKKIDYTSFKEGGSPELNNDAFQKRWWKASGDELHQSIIKTVNQLVQFDSKRQQQYQVSTRLYGNSEMLGINGLSMSKLSAISTSAKDRVTYNVVQSVIDTITAKIGKNKPKPLFLTSGGDQKMQRKAKKLDKFVEGVFYENDSYALGATIFRDACVIGDGLVHVYAHNNRVKFERALASELYVDAVEAFYGEPRQLHRVKMVDRDVLTELFPKHKKDIANAKGAESDKIGSSDNIADQIQVVESWHLPSGPDADDGKHCIVIDGCNLFEEQWDKDFFPFAQLSWSKRLFGNWGQGLAEQIQNIQLEINKILYIIQRSMHLAGSFKVLMQNGSKIVKEHLNNDIGAIISYNGTPPQYITPPIVPVELYQHLQTLKNSAFEQAGVSQLSASSQKPAGLNSGKALREYNDIETERFMTVGQGYERFFMQLAKLSISVAKDIYEDEGDYKVSVPGKRFIETIDWKDVDLTEDQYIMKVYPISSLPSDPAGRLQTIQEYAQAGYIDSLTAQSLLDFPDLEQVESLTGAQKEWILSYLDKIVDDGDYNPPEPEMNLQLAKQLVLQYIAQGSINKVEPEKMDMLRTFNTQLGAMVAQASQAAQPQGQAPAVPMAPPQSDLLPNVAGAA